MTAQVPLDSHKKLLRQIALPICLFYHSLIDGTLLQHQVIVSTLLDDTAVIDNGNAVSISHRLQSVCDYDGSHLLIDLITGLKKVVQSSLYYPLTLTVQSARKG